MTSNEPAVRPVVSVYGSSMSKPHDRTYSDALKLGRLLAEYGADVACGGYGGLMEAVSTGAREAGGGAIGFTVDGWAMRTPNRFLSDERPCTDLYDRLRHLIEDADALIALGGGIGTLVEVALAWNQLFMRLIDPRPLILVGPDWSRAIGNLRELLEISDAHLEHVTFCTDVEAAMVQLRSEGVV